MQSGGSRGKLTEFLGLRRNTVALFAMVVLVGMGEKVGERFLPLYLIALGGGTFSVGILNGMNNLLNALYSFPGGYTSDRWGYKRALLLFNLLAISGYTVVIMFPTWQAAIIGVALFLSWSAISLPAIMDMIATALPGNKRTMGVSMHSLVRRIPMALGPILGGSLISLYGEIEGMRIAFIAALILAGVSLVLLQLFIDAPREDRKAVTRQSGISGLKLLHPSLRNLLVSDIMVRFCEQIPYAFVVLWCVSINRITPFEFGILTAIEMITSALVYLPVAYFADKGTKKPFVVITFGFFTLFPIVLLMAESFWVLVIAFIIRGLKEFGEPTRKALIMDLAPEGRKATTFGIYYLVRDLFVSVAAFAGALLWDPSTMSWIVDAFHAGYFLLPLFDLIASPATNLLTAFAFGLAGTLYFLVWGRDVHVAPPIHEEGKNG